MNIVVKICFCVVGCVLVRQLVPDTFQYGYIAGALMVATTNLAGWFRGRLEQRQAKGNEEQMITRTILDAIYFWSAIGILVFAWALW